MQTSAGPPGGDGKGGGRAASPALGRAVGVRAGATDPGWERAPGAARSLTSPAEARRGTPRGAEMCLRLGGLSVGDFRKVLMKTGLVLVVLGHVSFIAAALLHGTVLRYVAAPHDAVALQYCVVNILSVTSAILVITSGIAATLLSRYLSSIPLRWAVFSLSTACALLSLTCALGLLASIAVTFATEGRALLAACTFGSPELLVLTPDCPFDPTRIYSSSLCLWGISMAFCMAESLYAVRSAQLAHQLLELRPWRGKSSHHTGSSQAPIAPFPALPGGGDPE
ncbi:transmembrane protein 54 isoform X2 [Dasypus novemcinctus]|uniref:transmembrane protein 54 isoform X2 n=1 Tax=Dasypus novemcinctus TaxID=9361 RepID=UPI00265E339B|nr:transmembrane protein 54 isoform X2 [Dasypus novemcinctus]